MLIAALLFMRFHHGTSLQVLRGMSYCRDGSSFAFYYRRLSAGIIVPPESNLCGPPCPHTIPESSPPLWSHPLVLHTSSTASPYIQSLESQQHCTQLLWRPETSNVQSPGIEIWSTSNQNGHLPQSKAPVEDVERHGCLSSL